MKVHLYKVIKLDDYSNDSDLEKMQVMTENDLRREFVWAYDNGRIPHDLVCDYQKDPDYKDEHWDDMGNLKAGTMVDMLNDICHYTCGDGYYILETDIEL